MISPSKHMLSKYHIFFMKMTLEAPIITLAKSNLCLFTNVDILLGLNAIMPLLEVVHSFIKFTQLCDMFVCGFIVVVKICEGNVYQIYCDIHSFFQVDMFMNFETLINCVFESISLP
jgi:hypothetical protein